MTATDELRRLLDERGVEHYDGTETTLWGYEPTSENTGAYRIAADEIGGGRMQLRMFNVTPEQAIEATLGEKVTGDTSDGYHTFNELYHHRAVLFSVIVRDHKELAWKSRHHHDGSMFDCRELDRAPEWDGHSPSDAIGRIATLGRGECRLVRHGNLADWPEIVCWSCSVCNFGWHHSVNDKQFNYCPNCGARVVE